MGLGPSWVILNLINAFSSWRAGASRHSFRICGDDLVGLWPQHVIDAYKRNMRLMGLVINEPKSFTEKGYGVFCERIVARTGPRTAASKDIGHLSDFAAMRATALLSADPVSTCANLLSHTRSAKRLIVRLVHQTCRNILPSGLPQGPIQAGGQGRGCPTAAQLWQLADKGPVKSYTMPKLTREAKELVGMATRVPEKGIPSMPLSEALLNLRAADAYRCKALNCLDRGVPIKVRKWRHKALQVEKNFTKLFHVNLPDGASRKKPGNHWTAEAAVLRPKRTSQTHPAYQPGPVSSLHSPQQQGADAHHQMAVWWNPMSYTANFAQRVRGPNQKAVLTWNILVSRLQSEDRGRERHARTLRGLLKLYRIPLSSAVAFKASSKRLRDLYRRASRVLLQPKSEQFVPTHSVEAALVLVSPEAWGGIRRPPLRTQVRQ